MRLSTLRDAIVVLVIVAALALGLLLRVGASVGGALVAGEVIGKREAIEMPLDDTWRQVFEVSYRYRPPDAPRAIIGKHPVDAALFDRLHVGSRVGVRYRRLPFLGGVTGVESALDEASWWSRAAVSSESTRETVELGAFALSGLIGFIAYRLKNRSLGLFAATVCVAVASTVLLLGFVAFPLLFWMWLANPRRGFGWVLVVSTAITAAGLYYRVPWPPPLSDGAQYHATALIRAVRVVDRIWASASSDESSGGQSIRRPFQMIDLEFMPAGWTETVHAVDRVDLGSVPALRVGAAIPVVYSDRDPRGGRISVGTRNFGREAAIYLFGLTYGIGALVAIVGLALLATGRLLAATLRRYLPVLDIAASDRFGSPLPDDHPARKILERLRRVRNVDP